jgi:hypothetical protein
LASPFDAQGWRCPKDNCNNWLILQEAPGLPLHCPECPGFPVLKSPTVREPFALSHRSPSRQQLSSPGLRTPNLPFRSALSPIRPIALTYRFLQPPNLASRFRLRKHSSPPRFLPPQYSSPIPSQWPPDLLLTLHTACCKRSRLE